MTGSLVERIHQRDATLWGPPGAPEIADRLGWLDLPETMPAAVEGLTAFADEVRGTFGRVVLCGMGGSSLAPEVLWRAFGKREGYPSLHLLDTTHPDAIAAVAEPASPGAAQPHDLFIIASKSGTTIETTSLFRFFWERAGHDGSRFVAITDPGTPLAAEARAKRFRRVFDGPPDVGGRFSALSVFGLVPAALIGVDIDELLARARFAAAACRRPEPTNFWLRFGRQMADAAGDGRDKLTFLLSPRVDSLGVWLEQLIAESTGKEGRGIVPVIGERPDQLGRYGGDRLFVRIGILNDPMAEEDQDLSALDQAGHPVLRTDLDDPSDLGAQFFGWEFAVAIAGHLLDVNPFTQPDVAESKRNTERMLEAGRVDERGATPADVQRLLDGLGPGDYVAVQAFVHGTAENGRRLRRLQRTLRHRSGAAVTVGYGPRYLHSTGQLHKGGPPAGRFLQIVEPPSRDYPIPGAGYSFGRLLAAQADGDLEALTARGRPVVRVAGWRALEEYVA